jgi:hypothetical protein
VAQDLVSRLRQTIHLKEESSTTILLARALQVPLVLQPTQAAAAAGMLAVSQLLSQAAFPNLAQLILASFLVFCELRWWVS